MSGTVLVTGGSGYIAGFLIRQLVERGWTVNTTIRNLAKEAQVRATLGVAPEKLRFFAADLEQDAGWAEAMAGCSHVAHVASPFPAGAVSDDVLIPPARDGALRALRFAKAAGVKRFVLTSSVAAIAYGHPPANGAAFTERDWTDINAPGVGAYIKSKTVAERAARDWMAEHGAGMEFCSVNPSAVLGPVLSDDYSTSIQFVQRLLDGSVPGFPRIGFAVVDVRDLADLHVRALETPGLDGERFIGGGRFMQMEEVGAVLRARLGDKARKVPKRRVPDFVLRLMALFDGSIRQVVGELGRVRAIDPGHTAQVLGWRTRDEEQSIVDTAESLIERGIVKV
ncbi:MULTISPECIES: NAD-dependent epimerase/dehydratase family protein [Sphingomonas]|uniref:NAD-dependent epimerase/dehydratase family protein n=1 Tax=Sphingomonas lycopersici TaxID=2951807 RepID=A0AA41ZFU3_9SPHN|nr:MULTISPECIES: NAD-dependent epimerase/dehydratase family protein [Sphingomonas]MCW6532081.1 NAD-dependent epimerase/dehydratase family protein [Sphingomonas lycopersici]MCW6535841.1 NAD-dependent epimerase/dehydratase family protein [Sphingomonas lycopersici]OJU15381.1 MAG: epimerase [Sphingomonas sp. 66-10]